MSRLKRILTWSPYDRGTWQAAVFGGIVVIAVWVILWTFFGGWSWPNFGVLLGTVAAVTTALAVALKRHPRPSR